jgi:hypothetical protein
MTNKEINSLLAELDSAIFLLEDEYEQNGGEITIETEEQEKYIASLKALLENEGIDSLGRWLKTKEDYAKTLKAERDALNREIKKAEGGIDYIKRQLYKVMKACGLDEAKGQMGYKFVPTISQTTEVNKEFLNEKYAYLLNEALEYYKVNFGVELPEWVSYSLGASVKAFREVTNGECELPGEFILTEKETCTFTKPRANKKKEDIYGENS